MSVAPNGGLTSVDRALRILELLGDHRGVRVMDLAEHLGVARSTAHRLLQALVYRQFVVQDANKLYHRGLSAPRLASATFALRSCGPWCDLIWKALRRGDETCHLAVLEGNGARFIDGVGRAARSLRVGLRNGMLLPAHITAVGKALLAELSKAEFFALYPRGLSGSPTEVPKLTALRQELVTTRKRGYATNFDDSVKGVTAATVSLKDTSELAVASIAVACPSARCPRSGIGQLVEQLREAADAVEKAVPEVDLVDSGNRKLLPSCLRASRAVPTLGESLPAGCRATDGRKDASARL